MSDPREHPGSYRRFFLMIGTSMIAMFFLMYLHSYHVAKTKEEADSRPVPDVSATPE